MGQIRILSKNDRSIFQYQKSVKEMKEIERMIITPGEKKELQRVKLENENSKSICGRY